MNRQKYKWAYYYITPKGIKANLKSAIFSEEERKILEYLKKENCPVTINKIMTNIPNMGWTTINYRIEDLIKDELVGIKNI